MIADVSSQRRKAKPCRAKSISHEHSIMTAISNFGSEISEALMVESCLESAFDSLGHTELGNRDIGKK
jgi:hypothetical protein